VSGYRELAIQPDSTAAMIESSKEAAAGPGEMNRALKGRRRLKDGSGLSSSYIRGQCSGGRADSHVVPGPDVTSAKHAEQQLCSRDELE